MTFTRIAFCVAGLLLIIAAAASESFACSCGRSDAPLRELVEQEKQLSDAIFSGKVLSIIEHHDDGYISVELEVLDVWKGQLSTKVTVLTGVHDGNCRYPFEQDKTYLVYARNDDMYSPVKTLSTHICLRTASIAEARADIRILGKKKKPQN